MNDLPQKTPRKPDIPEDIQAKWQRFVDLMAGVLDVSAGAIMKADPPQVEVFLSSVTEGNPFRRGDRLKLDSGLYCERVMRERAPLLVPDARKDPEWQHGSMIGMGMNYFLGFPLLWPDREIFGSICFFDQNDNPHASKFQELLSQIRELIEKDLRTLVEIGEREGLMAELQRHRDHLREMVAEQIAELEKSKKILEEQGRFEDLASNLSARFVDIPPARVEDEIVRALNEVCRFFKADHCGLLEVLAGGGQVCFISSTDKEERQRKGLSVDVAPSHPWAISQLIEKGEPVIFSSLAALPPEASVDRASWEQEGTQSLLVLPLRVAGQVTHLIGLRSARMGHEWPLLHLHPLRILGEVLANALIHKRAQEASRRSELQLIETQRIAHLGSWNWDINGRYLH